MIIRGSAKARRHGRLGVATHRSPDLPAQRRHIAQWRGRAVLSTRRRQPATRLQSPRQLRTPGPCPDERLAIAGVRKLHHVGQRGVCSVAAIVLALNNDRYLECLFGLPYGGFALVPINTRLAPPEIALWLVDSEYAALFVDDAFLPILAKVLP